jgi:hypothetical protein
VNPVLADSARELYRSPSSKETGAANRRAGDGTSCVGTTQIIQCPTLRSFGVSPHISLNQNWYAIVIRKHPETILVVDRSLLQGWMTTQILYPEIGPEDMAFRTLPEKEFNAM